MGGSDGQVFVSYRREETQHVAGRLADILADRFGADHVFMDVDSLQPGADFTKALERAVGSCRVLLALIGPRWVDLRGKDGNRRLDDPHDWVVLEIRAALARGIRVIPVLVDGASMPAQSELPPSLDRLPSRHAFALRFETFRSDSARLVQALEAEPVRTDAEIREVAVLPHPGRVAAVKFAESGQEVFTACADGTIRAWDIATSSVTWLVRHMKGISDIALQPDGQRIAGAVPNKGIHIWKRDSEEPTQELTAACPAGRLDFSSDGSCLVATVGTDIHRWVLDENGLFSDDQIIHSGKASKLLWRSLEFLTDGRVWGCDMWGRMYLISGPGHSGMEQSLKIPVMWSTIAAVGMSADARFLAASYVNPTTAGVKVFSVIPDGGLRQIADISERRAIRKYASNRQAAHAIAFSRDGATMTVGYNDGRLEGFDTESQEPLFTGAHGADERRRKILALAHSADDSMVASASADHTARVWSTFRD